MKNNLILILITAVLVGGTGFFGGMKYQQTQTLSNSNLNRQTGQRQGRFANGGGAVGEIISQDATSLTIKLQDGSSKIVLISGNTKYSKNATASASDLKTGERVAAFGTLNSDGSITTLNVQINPMTGSGRNGMPNQ